MNAGPIRRTRILHTVLLTIFILVVLIESIRQRVPYWEFALAIGYVWMWMLGISYERTVVVESGLASRAEIKRAEETGYRWLDWGKIFQR